jgi:hypothetical protein
MAVTGEFLDLSRAEEERRFAQMLDRMTNPASGLGVGPKGGLPPETIVIHVPPTRSMHPMAISPAGIPSEEAFGSPEVSVPFVYLNSIGLYGTVPQKILPLALGLIIGVNIGSHTPTQSLWPAIALRQAASLSAQEREGGEVSTWIRVLQNLIERDMIAEARSVLDKIPQSAFGTEQLENLRRVLAPPKVGRSAIRGLDRTREWNWLRRHSEDYRGKWVAVLGDELVASADVLSDLLEVLRERPLLHRPLIHRIPHEKHA